MQPADSFFHLIYTSLLMCLMMSYLGITAYAFLVRNPTNLIVNLATDMFQILSLSGRMQILMSLIYVLFSVLFYQKGFPMMGQAMIWTAALVVAFHSAQPLLFKRACALNMT